MLYEVITGISEESMKVFVGSRVNTCLNQLGYKGIYDTSNNPVAEWFYKGINRNNFV